MCVKRCTFTPSSPKNDAPVMIKLRPQKFVAIQQLNKRLDNEIFFVLNGLSGKLRRHIDD